MDMIPIVWFAIASIEDDFSSLARAHFPTLPKNGNSLWCAYIPALCTTDVPDGSFAAQVKQRALDLDYNLSADTTNECLLYDGPGADLYYGRPIIDPENTRFWRNSSRLFSSGNGEALIASDVRHLAARNDASDMLCPCVLGMRCTRTGPHLPSICTIQSITHTTTSMWVVFMVLLAVAIVILYVATDD